MTLTDKRAHLPRAAGLRYGLLKEQAMNRSDRIPSKSALCFSFMLAALLPGAAGNVGAAETRLAAIEDLSIKDLMQVEVSSVSRKSQTLFDTAAAAFIVSQEDIRRSGATSIPEALRMVPGLEVAQLDAWHWAVTTRGFNLRFANKLLVLMDGRTVYNPSFTGVTWNTQDTMLEDIERIEVIRGPGAAMWGVNAVNGVINIITKKTKDTLGNLVVAAAGNHERGYAAYRHGGKLGDDGSYRVYGKGFSRDSTISTAGQTQNDTWQAGQAGFRMDRAISSGDRLTLQGDAYRQTAGRTTYPLTVLPPFNTTVQSNDHWSGANVLARWEGSRSNGAEFTLQAYYDRTFFNASFVSDKKDTLDLDFQHRLHPNASNDLMWGGNYRYIQSSMTNTAALTFTPADVNYQNVSVFVQDDIALSPNKWRLTLGSKLEKTYYGGTQFQPNARMLWTPDSTNSVWAAVSQAARSPTPLEMNSSAAQGTFRPVPPILAQVRITGTPNLSAERVTTTEIGYRTQWSSRFSSDIAAFSSRYTNLIIIRQGTFNLATLTLPLTFVNSAQDLTTRGLELSADWNMLDWMRLSGTYTYLAVPAFENAAVPDPAGHSPRHHGSLRAQMDFNKRSKLDLMLRYTGELPSATGYVSPYTAFDARYAYAPRPGLEYSLVARNLFAPHHLEWRDATPFFPVPSQIPRSIFAKVTWSY